MYAFETLEESIIHVIKLKMPTSRRNREAKKNEVVYRMKGGLAMDLPWIWLWFVWQIQMLDPYAD